MAYPPVGGSAFSTQKWRAWAYATIFSHWTSQISQQVKMETGGSSKFLQCRHSSAGGAWWSFFTWHCSLALCRSQKEAHTSHANFLWSSTPGTMNNSCPQLGVSYAQALQVTHFSNSSIGGLGEGIFTFSSTELLTGPQRKQLTSGLNSGGSSKSKSSGASSSPSDSETLWEGGISSRGHDSLPATPGSTSSSVPWIYVCSSPCFENGLEPLTGSW